MATITRSSLTRAPVVERLASVGTNWQEWVAPPWATQVVIRPDGDAWYALTSGISGATEPADGDAATDAEYRGTIKADAAYVVLLRNAFDRPVNVGLTGNRSIFVAAKASTITVELEWSAA